MWFDALSALATIEGRKQLGSEMPDQALHPTSAAATDIARRAPVLGKLAGLAELAAPRREKPQRMVDTVNARSLSLPSAAPICASCGVADWQVSLYDKRRRSLHVACWLFEQSGNA